MIKKIFKSFSLAIRLYTGNGKYLFYSAITGITIFFLKPLFSPVFLRLIYDSIADNSINDLIYASSAGAISVLAVAALSYFLIVYADAWASYLVAGGCVSSFKTIYDVSLHRLNSRYDPGDLFVRITQGSDAPASVVTIVLQCMAMILSLSLISMLLYRISPYALVFALLMVVLECFRIKYEIKRHYQINMIVQEEGARLNEIIHRAVESSEQLLFLNESNSLKSDFGLCLDRFWSVRADDRRVTLGFSFISDAVFAALKTISFATLGMLPRFSMGSLGSLNSMVESFRDTSNMTVRFASELPAYLAKSDRIDVLLKEKDMDTPDTLTTDMSAPAIEFKDVFINLGNRFVLTGASFTISKGDKVALVGENGSGKSTVLKLILGNLSPSQGSINVFGRPSQSLTHVEKYDDISYIPVECQLFGITAVDNITMGSAAKEPYIPVDEDFLYKNANEISAGQKKRTSILRGIQKHPRLLIVDEPDAELNQNMASNYIDLLVSSSGTLLAVTHNRLLLDKFDYALVIRQGRIELMDVAEYLSISTNSE